MTHKPDTSWLRCPDCASTVHTEWPEPKVMHVTVEHSPTCPAWRRPEREVALMFLPPSGRMAKRS